MLAHLFGTVCLKHSATLILPSLLRPPSRCTRSVTISKLFFTAMPMSFVWCMKVCVCVCVCVSVIVKHPMLPPCVVDGCSRNPLFYYYTYGPSSQKFCWLSYVSCPLSIMCITFTFDPAILSELWLLQHGSPVYRDHEKHADRTETSHRGISLSKV